MKDIAIVGMGCLYPGADNPQQFWENLVNMKDCTTPLSKDILGKEPEAYLAEKRDTPDKIKYNKNGHIRDFTFNPEGYKVPAKDLQSLDELFQWTIYAADEALKDSGYKSKEEALKKCGLILGNISMPTLAVKKMYSSFYSQIIEPHVQQLLNRKDFTFNKYWNPEGLSDYNLMTASGPAVLACEALGLNGPVFSLDAACSTALYVIDNAVKYLRTGEADIMLAASICRADYIYLNHGFNTLKAMPDEGDSLPMDKNTDGLKTGEGVGVLALKRLSDAIRDNDTIHAVIENIGLSNDGGAKHILVPDEKGQQLALSRAYEGTSKDVDYIECHTTGTPVGDVVELNSIAGFYEDSPKTPFIGANKCNIGHLLTASAMPAVMKVIMGMKNDLIPATISVKDPIESKNKKISSKNMVLENMKWPEHKGVKRAGVNAFGFGGTNGHLVLREYDPEDIKANGPVEDKKVDLAPMAITGMASSFGKIQGVESFNKAMHDMEQFYEKLPATRWSGLETREDLLKLGNLDINNIPAGNYIEKVDFDCVKYKIPPKMVELQLIGHITMMPIADAACRDAGLEAQKDQRNIAVIITQEMDPFCLRYQARTEITWHIEESLKQNNITMTPEKKKLLTQVIKESIFPDPFVEGVSGGISNIVACRVSSHWKFNGPSFVISAQENSTFKAMQLAQFLLTFEDLDGVVIGAVDLGGGFEKLSWNSRRHPINNGNKTLSFDKGSTGWNIGEGGGAIFLKKYEDAKRDKDRIYSVVKSLKIHHEHKSENLDFIPSEEAVYKVSKEALEDAGLKAEQIGYLEVNASGFEKEDAAEAAGLSKAYASGSKNGVCAIGSAKVNLGHTFSASGLAAIMRTSIGLYNKYIPGTPGWTEAKEPGLFEKSLLYVPNQTKEWNSGTNTRYAAINSIGKDHGYVHMILEEPDREARENARTITLAEEKKKVNATVYIGRNPSIKEMILKEEYMAELQEKTAPQQKAPAAQANTAAGEGDIKAFTDNLIAIVSEKTGYPTDMIDLDMDLEADMGIDSIKRVEILGTLFKGQEGGDMDGGLDFDSIDIDDFKTLRNIISFITENADTAGSLLGSGGQEEAEKAAAPVTAEPVAPIAPITPAAPAAPSAPVKKIEPVSISTEPVKPVEVSTPAPSAPAQKVAGAGLVIGGGAVGNDVYKNSNPGLTNTASVTPGSISTGTAFAASSQESKPVAVIDTPVKTIEENTPPVFNEPEVQINQVISNAVPNTAAAPGIQMHKAMKKSFERMMRTHQSYLDSQKQFYDYLTSVFEASNKAPTMTVINPQVQQEAAPAQITQEVSGNAAPTVSSVSPAQSGGLAIGFPPAGTTQTGGQAVSFAPAAQNTGGTAPMGGLAIGSAPAVSTPAVPAPVEIKTEKARIEPITISGAGQTGVTPPVSEPQKSEAKSAGVNPDDFAAKLLDIVSEKTGYPKDMIDLDMDLEADMGIDSIKRVEILGTLFKGDETDEMDMDSFDLDSIDIDEFRTLRNIINFVAKQSGGAGETVEANTPAPAAQTADAPVSQQPAAPSNGAGVNPDDFAAKLLDIVSEKTGYPKDMIDLDMDLEADMGIDSIKRVEILGTLFKGDETDEMDMDSFDLDSIDIDEFRTLRNIINFVAKQSGGAGGNAPEGAGKKPEAREQEINNANKTIIFDEKQLVELTDGLVANVLGPEYAESDSYAVRTRMPSPPFMFASRITRLTAEKGKLEPSEIEWEYDIPEDAYYVSHGQVPSMVPLESSHAMIVAFTYIGCDQMFKGELSYRALDSTTTVYSDFPKAGDTLKGHVQIKSYSMAGKNIVIAYEYNCYVEGRHVFKLEATSGFFPKSTIEGTKGMARPMDLVKEPSVKKSFDPILSCSKTSFSDEELNALQDGDLDRCFGEGFGKTPAPGICAPKVKMLDRVISADPKGGVYGLGELVGERDIHTDHWVFKAHFKNDPCVPGTLLVEGCWQLTKFFMYYMGLHSLDHLVPTVSTNHKFVARFRGEVKCVESKIRYRLTCKDIEAKYKEDGKTYEELTILCTIEILNEENTVTGVCRDMGFKLVDKALRAK